MTENQREAYQALQASLDNRDNGGEKAYEAQTRQPVATSTPRADTPTERA